jgi:hypothetical protein
MRVGDYVRAKDCSQRDSERREPDVYVGPAIASGKQGEPVNYYTVEVAPAMGNIAQVRLSVDELIELWDLIAYRLGVASPTVHMQVPKAMTVEIERT